MLNSMVDYRGHGDIVIQGGIKTKNQRSVSGNRKLPQGIRKSPGIWSKRKMFPISNLHRRGPSSGWTLSNEKDV